MAVRAVCGRSPIAKETWQSTHLRKFGNHLTEHRASEQASYRSAAPQVYQCERIQTIGMASQMHKRFYLEGNHMAARTFRKKKVVSFSALFFMFTLTWITEKELERVIENKGDEFRRKKNMEIQSGGEKMRNASGQQGENERQ